MSNDRGIDSAADLFRVLASPLRLRLLRLLAQEPTTVGALCEATGVSQPLVSQHLRVLRSSGVVVVTRRGREAHYAVADDHVTHVIEDAIAHVLEEPPIHPSTEKEITP